MAPEVLTAEQQLFPHLKEVRNTIEDLTGFLIFFFFLFFSFSRFCCLLFVCVKMMRTGLPITYSDFVLMKIGMVGNATGFVLFLF